MKKVYLVTREITTLSEVYVLAENEKQALELAEDSGYGKEEVINEDTNTLEVINPSPDLYVYTPSRSTKYSKLNYVNQAN